MKLISHRMVGWRTSCLRSLVVILGLIAGATISAQESKPAGQTAKPVPTDGEADPKTPDAIQPFTSSIVTVTRFDPKTGKTASFLNGHAGIVVDPRGYIVTPMVDAQAKTMRFKVRMLNDQLFVAEANVQENVAAANGEEFVAELAASDETLKLMILKVVSPHPLAAVSLAKIRDARVGDKVLLVTSPLSRGEFSGRVTSTTVDLGVEGSPKFLQTDIKFPLSESGSLMVSELGEPIGIFMASLPGEPPVSMATPMKLAQKLIDQTTKPNATESPAESPKPLQSGLLPPTPLVKSLVELFAPRGAKVLEYEEGKLLKVEAPSDAIEEIGKLLELVGRESQKQEDKAEPIAPTASKIPDIVGTWSRAVSGTFSKLTIWPVENREFLFFVEGADGNGLVEWKPAAYNYQGTFSFNLLGDRSALAYLVLHGPMETRRLIIEPFEDQRIQLLRSDFAKTEREFDKKLSSDWTRVEVPAQPMPTVTVVKTEFRPSFIRDVLRAKYREPPYRFYSNDTFRSVIVLAPAEAQEDIEVLIHKVRVDGPEARNDQVAPPNIAQQSPAKQPEEEETDETKFFHLESSDATTTLDVVEKLFQGRIRRISADRRTNALIVVALPSVCSEVEAVVLKLDSTPTLQRPAEADRFRAIPDTPAAKQLVEQLGAQESAAAAEAATIRQLQANGQAEQNKQPIAEHQRKLKNLLSTAFDLKLQLEELQVQELQSRLSRLERQIGQRKELREKIIARRAGELIEGETLKWNAAATTPTKLPGQTVGDDKMPATPAVVAILRERVDLLLNDMRIGNARPEAVLRAINELAQAEPPKAHAQHVARLQTLLEFTRRHVGTDTDSFSKAELLEIEAAYEKARSSDSARIKFGSR